MILNVTLNPSVDINYPLDYLKLNTTNRVKTVTKTAGGKGLNVSRVLQQIGEEVGTIGFLGGYLGDFIRSEIATLGIRDYFVNIQGNTRNCIGIIHDHNQQTEILEAGPVITENEEMDFLNQFSNCLEEVNIVTISGSLPKGLKSNFYKRLIKISASKSIPVLLDTNGDLLADTLESNYQPHLIKPNLSELEDFIGTRISNTYDVVNALSTSEKLSSIPYVVVTMGSKGAVIKDQEKFYKLSIPNVEKRNPIGSGDSVIAGFAAGLSRKMTGIDLFRFGLSMGVLNAMEDKTGYVNVDDLDWCIKNVKVEEII